MLYFILEIGLLDLCVAFCHISEGSECFLISSVILDECTLSIDDFLVDFDPSILRAYHSLRRFRGLLPALGNKPGKKVLHKIR